MDASSFNITLNLNYIHMNIEVSSFISIDSYATSKVKSQNVKKMKQKHLSQFKRLVLNRIEE